MTRCAAEGCSRKADAAGGTRCATHATVEMFGETVLVERPAEPATPEVVNHFVRNFGTGSRSEPVAGDEGADAQALKIVNIAQRFGECWINTDALGPRLATNRLFELGYIVPIPRVARQPRHLARFQLTQRGVDAAKGGLVL